MGFYSRNQQIKINHELCLSFDEALVIKWKNCSTKIANWCFPTCIFLDFFPWDTQWDQLEISAEFMSWCMLPLLNLNSTSSPSRCHLLSLNLKQNHYNHLDRCLAIQTWRVQQLLLLPLLHMLPR